MQTRRTWLAAAGTALFAQTNVQWVDSRSLTIEGQGWRDTAAPFDRLPAKAETLVRPEVWNLSRHSAGIVVRFRARASAIHARWTLGLDRLAIPNTAGIGHSGLDLYARDAAGKLRWLGFGSPTKFPTNEVALVSGMKPEWRDYQLYLPLFNSVLKLELGVPAGEEITPAAVRPQPPIVFYGTSITHGAGASRAGMTHVAILGRRFDRPVINLGFSGNGRMEIEVARLLGELEPALYVVDCLPNIEAPAVTERTEPLIRELRRARPRTPILLVEDRTYQDAWLAEAKLRRNQASRAALRAVYDKLRRDKFPGLGYVDGESLLGTDGEGTVDSSHPNDLGYVRQADAIAPALRQLLQARPWN